MSPARQRQKSSYDLILLFPVLFLLGIGIVMVYSASSALALKSFGSQYYFLKRQAFFAVAGIGVMVVCRNIPYKIFRPLAYPLLVLALVFLVLLLVPRFAVSAGGATRWLKLGIVAFQPSEFARLALVVFLAYSMSKKEERLDEFAIGFVPHVAVLAIMASLIILEPDFGSVIILGCLTWVLLFVGGVRTRYLLGALLPLVPVIYWLMVSAQYRLRRLLSFLHPWAHRSNTGYQIVNSLMAFGSGGLWGTGVGKGYQKLFYLPEPHTDFIFSVIGEELGMFWVLGILVLFAIVIWRGILIARRTPDTFGALLAVGLTTAIGLGACINMAVALGLLPTKGLTLPFLSYGGSSLMLNLASIGILMNIGGSR